MRKKLLFSILFFAFASQAQAEITDEVAQAFMRAARSKITMAKLQDGSFVKAETPQELQSPIIPLADGKRVIEVGSRSGVGAWCAVDWQSHYLNFMQQERAKRKWSDKQIAYIGLLHGYTNGAFEHEARERGACSKDQAAHIVKILENSGY